MTDCKKAVDLDTVSDVSTKFPLSCVRFCVLLELLNKFELLKSALESDLFGFSLHRCSTTLHFFFATTLHFFFPVSDLYFLLLLLSFT